MALDQRHGDKLRGRRWTLLESTTEWTVLLVVWGPTSARDLVSFQRCMKTFAPIGVRCQAAWVPMEMDAGALDTVWRLGGADAVRAIVGPIEKEVIP